VFWLTRSEFLKLPRHAPDFWAFRHKVVDFPELPPRQDIVRAGVQEEDLAGAIERYQQALRQDFDDPSIHQKLAELFRAAGCYEDAVFHFKRSVRLAPGNENYLLGLAQTQRDMGQEHLARRTQRRAYRLSQAGNVEGSAREEHKRGHPFSRADTIVQRHVW
jgi:tetratricopeptide (TPR) repeat protein